MLFCFLTALSNTEWAVRDCKECVEFVLIFDNGKIMFPPKSPQLQKQREHSSHLLGL